MIKLKLIILSMVFFYLGSAFANSTPPHTWHNISAKNGVWSGSLRMINEKGHFVTRNGLDLNNFTVTPDQSQEYGFVLDPNNDFDVAYTVTLTQQSATKQSWFESKACVYIVTAKGPAEPDINVSAYHGAQCHFEDPDHTGVNFIVE
jgi:hypothetical protein